MMRRIVTILVMGLALALGFLQQGTAAPPGANRANLNPGIRPPNSCPYGKSLQEWLGDYWRWYYTGGAAETMPFRPGKAPMVFMPIPQGEQLSGDWTADNPAYLKGELQVTLPQGTAFVMPMFAWVAERYDPATGQPDDPSVPEDRLQFTVTGLDGTGLPVVTLDGEPILQNFWDYYVEPTPFDPIIEYPEASSYGSVAAISFQGVGFIPAPLTPGTHVLKLLERMVVTNENLPDYQGDLDMGIIYDNTWIITVE
jgi:hypothetical protein